MMMPETSRTVSQNKCFFFIGWLSQAFDHSTGKVLLVLRVLCVTVRAWSPCLSLWTELPYTTYVDTIWLLRGTGYDPQHPFRWLWDFSGMDQLTNFWSIFPRRYVLFSPPNMLCYAKKNHIKWENSYKPSVVLTNREQRPIPVTSINHKKTVWQRSAKCVPSPHQDNIFLTFVIATSPLLEL